MSEEDGTLDKFLKDAVGVNSELHVENLEVWASSGCDTNTVLYQAWQLVFSGKMRSITLNLNDVKVKMSKH